MSAEHRPYLRPDELIAACLQEGDKLREQFDGTDLSFILVCSNRTIGQVYSCASQEDTEFNLKMARLAVKVLEKEIAKNGEPPP